MRDLTDRALETATILGAGYADARVVRRLDESIAIKTGVVEGVATGESEGFGVRVLVDGAWGFASSHVLSLDEADRVAAQAVRIARASATALRDPVVLDDRPPAHGTYETPLVEDPFAVPLEAKIADLLAADAEASRVPGIVFTESMYAAQREWKTFAATDGSFTEQTLTHVGSSVEANAIAGDEHQRRSFPDAGGGWNAAGYEYIRGLGLTAAAGPLAEEAMALLSAPQSPSGRYTVILDPSQLYLQLHESCGHPTELDRAMGTEITLAGGSFLDPGKLGTFRYGSEHVTMTAGSTAEGGVGTFGWDDEGTPAGEHVLVDRGTLVDFLSSRETAAAIGRASTGTMRASGFDRIPLIRMTNVSLAPRSGTLEDLVADTKDGVLIATDRSWSIDDQRLDFQFSCEIGWRIENGKRTTMLRRPLYAGSTPRFWGSCDAVCGPEEWLLWGISSCGKGDPIQIVSVGHGAAPARFRRVRVGSAS